VERVCLGVIVAAHGIQGQVKVKCFTAEPGSLVAYGELTDAAGVRRFRLKLVGPTKGGMVAKLEGVSDRNAAEALKGTELYVARAALPEPAEEEYYHADLIGLRVELVDGTVLGRVLAMHDFGAGDLVEVARDGKATIMLPFTRAVVPVVDVAGGRLVVEPPAEVAADEAGKELM
jgi:16S rRNA processing protein RimM